MELTREQIEQNEEKIVNLLRDTKIMGIDNLILAMVDGGFFTAPCSGAYHLCIPGGLALHSINVLELLKKLSEAMGADLDMTDMVVCALLHDLGKMGDHSKPNYVVNMVRSKSKNKETGEYDMVQSTAKPYEVNKELYAEEHEIRSVIIAERYIALTQEQEGAILHHNGLFGKLDSSFGNHGYDRDKLAFLLHTADMYASRFVEVEE